MNLLPLLWQIPAVFTAVPLVHRLLPFRLAARAIPLFYTVISWLVMMMPDRIDLGLAAAGLITLLHRRLGVTLATEEPADVQVLVTWLRDTYQVMANLLVLGYDYASRAAPRNTHLVQDPTVHDKPEDGKPEDDGYQEPPKAPPGKITQRIPHL